MDYNLIILEIAKVFIGAILGTVVTSFYKDFKDKKDQQKELFIRMVKAKSYIQIPQMLINDMNIIEILFRNNKRVLSKYRDYYEILCLPESQVDLDKQMGVYLDLLREIGNVVGYKHLDNKTLVSRYIPNAAMDEHYATNEFNKELLNYLKSGNELYKVLAENASKST
jgi:hypothetical protein